MQQSGAAAGSRGCALFPLLSVLFFQGVHIVISLEINADTHVRGYVGEKIKLRCMFKSTSHVTDKLTIDWTYRPPSSSRTESIFHYQSFQYPTTAGTFRDRISWAGNVYKGDASISISNPTLKDNGTFSCAVKNPPDVHHNIPLTELTVTERALTRRKKMSAWQGFVSAVLSVWIQTMKRHTDESLHGRKTENIPFHWLLKPLEGMELAWIMMKEDSGAPV
ncbi:myelin protein zero-like protein 3 isoform X2 [Heterocephalus glaber]|uniref:Myelin protein zero-like protein 3 isoform X2 n=1 Tax=Heterocephalus glaber TaxID=10181 RepID=A0AAX6R118_HETGA|nr:myelin protein zero-like protein 3 isoform X2 [Heterocephalus glaber]